MGMVGIGTGSRSATKSLPIPLAGTFRLSRRHRRISLHGCHADAFDCLALNQSVGSNATPPVNLADAVWHRPRDWSSRAGLAGDFRLRPRFGTPTTGINNARAMDRSSCGITRLNFALLDGEMAGFLDALFSAQWHRVSRWTCSARRSHCRFY